MRDAPTSTPSAAKSATRRAWRFVGPLVAASALALAGCGSQGGSATPPTSSHGSEIVIQNFVFSPRTLTVAPGATVTVRNSDGVTHTLTADAGAFNSGNVANGATSTFTAPRAPGTYGYHCMIHQFMTGTLVVTSR